MLGVRVRWHGFNWCSGPDALTVSPGIDAYALFNPFSHGNGFLSGGRAEAGMATMDLDLGWRHRYGTHLCGEMGLNLGAGMGFTGNITVPVPLISGYIGLRY